MIAVTMLLTCLHAYDPDAALQPVPFTAVRIDDAFWAPRIAVNRQQTLPHNLQYCEQVGKVNNFLKAAKQMPGKHEGAPWEDSDVYKVIEGAAYCLALQRDAVLEQQIDDLVAKIAAAQQPDGYLDTFYTLGEYDKRWTDDSKHETYCAGHMIEGAVAYYQATAKRNFLDVAIRLADHIDSTFGPNGLKDVSEHEEIELALVKLWRVTGQDRYLKLAQFFLDQRGHYEGRQTVNPALRGAWGEYCQDHKPVREQSEIVGHAVRAMYLYSGLTDMAGITCDKGYADALDRVWTDVTQRKMYLTGGIGPSATNEGFTVPYDLPNDTAYCETCAAIGMTFWNYRMGLLHADAKYADLVERELYNGALSGVSLDGRLFFYVNPLASRGQHHRQPWHGCACCPTNVVRFVPSVGGYVYATGNKAIYVNQIVAGKTAIRIEDAPITLTQQTRYPWDGAITISVAPEKPSRFALHVRIPGWCQGLQTQGDLYTSEGKPESGVVNLKVNNQLVDKPIVAKGYAVLDREWKAGDAVEINMPMPIRRIKANPTVEADAGRVAIQRGPIVYCLEGVDNDGCVRNLALPPDAELEAEHRPGLLGGVTVITGTALARQTGDSGPQRVRFTAVPYYAWDNREPGQMAVWLPEDPARAEPRPAPTIAGQSKVSASHRHGPDTLEALTDQIKPARSGDAGVPRFTWWDHRGTREWVQYDFKTPCRVHAVDVYWFDDTGTGSCRAPKSWRLLCRRGEKWKPVKTSDQYGTKLDAYNRVTFDAIETSALRIEVELQPDYSGGILEWRVE